jgi:predicted ester cyclase
VVVSAKQLVERFYDEVWNRADENVARSILDPVFQFHASLGPQTRGPEGFVAYMRLIHAALADYSCEIEEIVEDGQRAAARMRFSGQHRGTLFGVAATGLQIAWSGAAFFNTNGSMITALWVLGDIDSVKQQLGLSNEIETP